MNPAEISMLIVTMMAAAVVAWQSWETRRSANAAQEAVRTANSALAIAQSEESNTRELLAEAVRLRIDSTTPEFSIMPGSPPAVLNDPGRDQPYRLPRDSAYIISATFGLNIANDSSMPLRLIQQGPVANLPNGYNNPNSEVVVAPNDFVEVEITVRLPVGQWAAITEWYQEGQLTTDDEFRLKHSFDPSSLVVFTRLTSAETGAWDICRVTLQGSAVSPVTGETGAWIADDSEMPLGVAIAPKTRKYYLSRSDNVELPSAPRLKQ